MPLRVSAPVAVLLLVTAFCLACGVFGGDDGDNPLSVDANSPAKIYSLSATAQNHEAILLTWIATGDDSMSGRASEYDIRYSSKPDSLAHWWDSLATVVTDSIAPRPAAQLESLSIGELLPDTKYCFRLLALDDAGNSSGYSNTAEALTHSTPAKPMPAVSPDSLSFSPDLSERSFVITNGGDGTLDWSILNDQDWISLAPTSGSTTTEDDTITVTINRSGLDAGDYSGVVTVIPAEGDAAEISIQMTVVEEPVLDVNPVALDFDISAIALEFTITNGGDGTLTWAVSDDQMWIEVSPASGTTMTEEDTIQVSVLRSGLNAGDYSGSITITPGVGDPQVVDVAMHVPESPELPLLVVIEDSLGFGTDLTEQFFVISNGGDGALTWTISDDQNWISLFPASGNTSTEDDSITVTIDRSGLSPGKYSGLVTVIPADGDSAEVLVRMTVGENPSLEVSPVALIFDSGTIALDFAIMNAGDGTPSWAISGDQTWISLSPTSGNTTTEDDTITVTIDRSGLSAGSYAGSVNITPGVGDPQLVDISMDVPGLPDPPLMIVTPGTLDFGVDHSERSFEITNGGEGTITWSISDDQAWISLSPTSGGTTTEEDLIAVTVDRSGLSPGDYSGVIAVASAESDSVKILIQMTVGEEPPSLVVVPGSLDFSSDRTEHSFSITNGGAGKLAWTILDDQTWITLSPTSGSTSTEDDLITVTIDRSGLSPGEYSGVVRVRPAEGDSAKIPVQMTVNHEPFSLGVTPDSFFFGADLTEQSFSITNGGGGTLTWSVTNDQNWLTLSPASGSTTTEADSITVTIDRTGLPPGDYSGIVMVISTRSDSTKVFVQMTVEGPPNLEISTTTLAFEISTTTQSFTITNGGGGTLTWSVTNDQNWLTLSPASGITTTEADSITVTIDRSGLSPGDYAGIVMVTSPDGDSTAISIQMTVEKPPNLETSTTALTFGISTTTQSFTISNSGDGTLTWTISDNKTWISASPTSGSITTGDDSITVTIDRTGLSPGDYSGSITITPDVGDLQQIDVSMTALEPPEIGAMVLVPPGTFMMGDGIALCGVDEHQVTLTSRFYFRQYEVTNQEYRDAVQWAWEQGYVFVNSEYVEDNAENPGRPLIYLDDRSGRIKFNGSEFTIDYGYSNHPVVKVNWSAAAAYCDWLSLQEGLNRVYYDGDGVVPYSVFGYRLPTDAEWEYVTQQAGERIYPWGNESPDCARVTCTESPERVGSSPQGAAWVNGTPVFDMASNVYEWCNDLHTCDLGTDPETDPNGTENFSRVMRGGMFGEGGDSDYLCSNRHAEYIYYAERYHGFRIARTDETGTPRDPSLMVLSSSFDFGTEQIERAFTIKNGGHGTLLWSVSNDQDWISVSPTSGSTTTEDDLVTTTVDRSGLPAGEYSGTVTVTADGGDAAEVAVQMTVVSPSLQINTTALSFGESTTKLSFRLSNGGPDTLSWTTSDDQPWMTVYPINGNTTTEYDYPLVTVDRSGLSYGSYAGLITITPDFGDPQTITVSMLYPAPLSPSLEVAPISLVYGTDLTERKFAITNGGDSSLTWTILDDQDWITISPTNGGTTTEVDSIRVIVNRTGLSDGMYSGSVTITPSVGVPQVVSVSMEVSGPVGDPLLVVSTDSLLLGALLTEQTFTITNAGAGAIWWQILNEHGWISVSPAVGFATSEEKQITVTIDRSGLPIGSYPGRLIVRTLAWDSTEIFVQMTVEEPTLEVNPVALFFDSGTFRESLTITNGVWGALDWSISDDQPWIEVSTLRGTTSTEEDIVEVSVYRLGLDAGIHSGTITITPETGHPEVVSVSLLTVGRPAVGEMALIPSGNFWMGGDFSASCGFDQRKITLTNSFYLGHYEVTVQEYRDALQWAYDQGFVTVTSSDVYDNLDGSSEKLLGLGSLFTFSGGVFTIESGKEDLPLALAWYGAVAYCDWLSMQDGLTRAYDHSTWVCIGGNPSAAEGYRLPTDAEWEYATQFAGERTYPWGNTYPNFSLANYAPLAGELVGGLTPVGTYPPGPAEANLYDMAGNQWEWCNDWHVCDLGPDPESDPPGPVSGSHRVIRGGAWYNNHYNLPAAARKDGVPTNVYGFRIARKF